MNTLAERHSLPHATWMELLEELLTSSPTENFPVSSVMPYQELILVEFVCLL